MSSQVPTIDAVPTRARHLCASAAVIVFFLVILSAASFPNRFSAASFQSRDREGAVALRLDDSRDRAAFTHWFTFLAEAQYFNAPANRPAEIVDCAALIRYAYREALRNHDARWAAASGLPLILPFDSVAKYNYPRTPTGPALFRTGSGDYAEFADAKSLRRYNTRFVTRDIQQAQPADLLFYRNATSHHSMIYIGPSQVSRDSQRYVVYHTGPDGRNPGEIRRPNTHDLLSYPDPQWRPLESNPNFLGVYRWSIL